MALDIGHLAGCHASSPVLRGEACFALKGSKHGTQALWDQGKEQALGIGHLAFGVRAEAGATHSEGVPARREPLSVAPGCHEMVRLIQQASSGPKMTDFLGLALALPKKPRILRIETCSS